MYSYCRDGEADHQDDEGDQEVGEAHLRLLYNILTLACLVHTPSFKCNAWTPTSRLTDALPLMASSPNIL